MHRLRAESLASRRREKCNLNNLNDWTQDYCYSDLDIIEAALRKKAELFRTPWLIEKYIGEHAEEL